VNTGNGSQPRRRPLGSATSRRGRLLIGGIVALVIATVLVAPVVLLSGSGARHAKPCAQPLRYQGREYLARPVAPARVVEGVAIGIGVTSGCGVSASNIDIRSLLGVKPTAAVGLAADQSSIYVRRGVCLRSSPRELLGCLSRSR
jgi:hypothetical protein